MDFRTRATFAQMVRDVDSLTTLVTALSAALSRAEERLAILEQRRPPGRPPKDDRQRLADRSD